MPQAGFDLFYVGSMAATFLASVALLGFRVPDKPRVTRYWRSILLCTAVWSFGRGLMALSADYNAAFFWMRFSYAGSIWLVPLWAVVVSEITGSPLGKRATGALFALFAVFAAYIPSESFIGALAPKLSFRYYDDAPGLAFHAWSAAYTILLIAMYAKLFLSIRLAGGIRRNQIAVFSLTGLLGFGGGITTFPLVVDIPVYPFGVVAIALYPLATSYGILHHRLMDINLALYRFSVFMAYALIFGLPMMLAVLSSHSIWAAYFILGIAIALGPSVHEIIKARVTSVVDRLPPFRGRYAHLRELETQKQRMAAATDVGSWAERLLAGVQAVFVPTSSSVFLHGGAEKVYAPGAVSSSALPAAGLAPLGPESALVQLLKEEKQAVVRELLKMDCPAPRAEAIDAEMRRLGAEITVPVFTAGEMTAVLNIGPKADGRMYNEADVAAIWGLVSAAEVALKAVLMADELVRKERLATMGQVAAIVGHEIRNALTAMSHSAYLLERSLPGQRARKHMDVIATQIASSQKFVGDILGYVREKKPALAPADLNAVVREAVASVNPPENVSVDIQLSSDIPKTAIDPDQMRQALVNLVRNAVEAMPVGGVLRVRSRAEGGAVHLSVADTGGGILPENVGKLFTPLFSTKPNGTGLGLLVVKSVVERHGGRVEVESVPGRGTAFHLHLPLNGAMDQNDHPSELSAISAGITSKAG